MAGDLDTVQNYLDRCRVLLQDLIAPYRYADADLVANLNQGIAEARRLRPDLFLSTLGGYAAGSLPMYDVSDLAASVDMDPQYRTPLMFYVAGYAQLRDDESTNDSRGMAFIQRFTAQLVGGGS